MIDKTASADRRRELGSFLMSRRARLKPCDVGLPEGRRRTLGLRREEVARLAEVSVSWYTWLEQGRDIRASTATLTRISTVLRMSRAEVVHLFTLASELAPPDLLDDDVMADLTLLVAAIDPVPAYARNNRWDILAWNPALAELFATDLGALPPHERNMIRLFFLHLPYRSLVVDWEPVARASMELLRMARARAVDKTPFDTLVDELTVLSPEFRTWWPEQDVRILSRGATRFRHPARGVLDVSYVVLNPEGCPDFSVVTYLAPEAAAAQRD